MIMFFILFNPFLFDSIIEAQKDFLTTAGIDPGFTHLQHFSLPLDHLAYTCFNSFFILLNSFSFRVELINNDAWH
jgi:hypothetical protein